MRLGSGLAPLQPPPLKRRATTNPDAHAVLVARVFRGCGKTQIFVISRGAARRGISLFLHLNKREIPRFARNDKINHFFRSLFRPGDFLPRTADSFPKAPDSD